MRKMMLLPFFICHIIWSQEHPNYLSEDELKKKADKFYHEGYYRSTLVFLEHLDSSTYAEHWVQYIAAGTYFNLGRTKESQDCIERAAEGDIMVRIRTGKLVRAMILKFRYEKNKDEEEKWRRILKKKQLYNRSCGTGSYNGVRDFLINHYTSLGDGKAVNHFRKATLRIPPKRKCWQRKYP